MINILRTPQVQIAQRSIPTGLVYEQNEKSLAEVGSQPLKEMLLARDWAALKEHHVDRRTNELYDTARKLVEQYASQAGSVAGEAGKEHQPVAEPMDMDAMLATMEALEAERLSA